MLKFFNKDKNIANIAERVEKAKTDIKDREALLSEYRPFIKNVLSRERGFFIGDDSDEYSVGLIAFDEAISKFDIVKSRSFLSFAEVLIKNRLIDYLRKELKHNHRVSIDDIDEEHFLSYMDSEIDDSAETVQKFNSELMNYGITVEDLLAACPKHWDTRLNSIKISKYIVENEALLKRLEETRRLPAAELTEKLNVSRKVLDSNRKFIIAVCIMLHGDNLLMKGYINRFLKGVEYDEKRRCGQTKPKESSDNVSELQHY